MADEEPFRTTLIFRTELIDKIDDLLHEGKKNGTIARNMNRNPCIVQLVEERVAQLTKGHGRKRSTD